MALDLISSPQLAYIVLGGFVVAVSVSVIERHFSMVSLLVKEKLYINEVVLGTAFGVLMGPHCANIFNPRDWGTHTNAITLELMRVVLATGLFAIGVELPQSYLADHVKGLSIMVIPTMAFGWVVIAGLIHALFPAVNYISALAISACLTPTDPIICAAIVGGKFAIKHVPTNLRRILSAESAANDGLAYPFISIAIYLTVETNRGVAIWKWFLVGWLYQVILGIVLGAVLGLGFCYLMKLSQRMGFIDRESYIAQYLALSLFTIGVTSTIGSDDLLAAFAAGSAISWDGHFNVQVEGEAFSSVIDLILNCGCFIYIGAWLPFTSFNSPELGITPWRLIILFIITLLVRRIPPLLLLYRWIPEINTWREALFSGHFGPMGVGAVFVSTLALTRLPTPQSPPQNQQELLAATLQPIVSFVVLGSIFIHGLSIPFFSFGRRVHSRTISISHTWTSRNSNVPDWLLWARRSPQDLNKPDVSTNASRIDLEHGRAVADTTDILRPDVPVLQSDVSGDNIHLDAVVMLDDPADNNSIRRRGWMSSEDISREMSKKDDLPAVDAAVDNEEAANIVPQLQLTPAPQTPKAVHFPVTSDEECISPGASMVVGLGESYVGKETRDKMLRLSSTQ